MKVVASSKFVSKYPGIAALLYPALMECGVDRPSKSDLEQAANQIEGEYPAGSYFGLNSKQLSTLNTEMTALAKKSQREINDYFADLSLEAHSAPSSNDVEELANWVGYCMTGVLLE